VSAPGSGTAAGRIAPNGLDLSCRSGAGGEPQGRAGDGVRRRFRIAERRTGNEEYVDRWRSRLRGLILKTGETDPHPEAAAVLSLQQFHRRPVKACNLLDDRQAKARPRIIGADAAVEPPQDGIAPVRRN